MSEQAPPHNNATRLRIIISQKHIPTYAYKRDEILLSFRGRNNIYTKIDNAFMCWLWNKAQILMTCKIIEDILAGILN